MTLAELLKKQKLYEDQHKEKKPIKEPKKKIEPKVEEKPIDIEESKKEEEKNIDDKPVKKEPKKKVEKPESRVYMVTEDIDHVNEEKVEEDHFEF